MNYFLKVILKNFNLNNKEILKKYLKNNIEIIWYPQKVMKNINYIEKFKNTFYRIENIIHVIINTLRFTIINIIIIIFLFINPLCLENR